MTIDNIKPVLQHSPIGRMLPELLEEEFDTIKKLDLLDLAPVRGVRSLMSNPLVMLD